MLLRLLLRGRRCAWWEWVRGRPCPREVTPLVAACASSAGSQESTRGDVRLAAAGALSLQLSGPFPNRQPKGRSERVQHHGQRPAAPQPGGSGGAAVPYLVHLRLRTWVLLRQEAREIPLKHKPALSDCADRTYPRSPDPGLNDNTFAV